MITLYEKIRNLKLNEGEVAAIFLGQAGFIYKSYPEHYVVIDPYLSDYCEEKIGLKFKRLFPALIDTAELESLPLQAYLLTHHHEDHLDVPVIEALRDTRYPFFAPPQSIALLEQLGIGNERCTPLFKGSDFPAEQFKVHGVFADHGEYAPDAVGIIYESHGKVIFHMGDTCFNEKELEEIGRKFKINLLIAPINGRYGNMDSADAAKAVAVLKPEFVMPCHFWVLPGNSGGDPEAFIDCVTETAPGSEVLLLAAGEIYRLS